MIFGLLSGLVLASGLQSGGIDVLTTSSRSSLPVSSGVVPGGVVPNLPEPKTYIVPITAYSSTVDQTDDTPFITASGKRVHDGIIAANFLPLGTKLRIPDIFGNKIFVVEDRMNKRNSDKVDIWMPTRRQAVYFGVQLAKIVLVDDAGDRLAEK